MPKQFCRFIPLVVICCASEVLARSPLCPKPELEEAATKLVADSKIFHQAMQDAQRSGKHLDWVNDKSFDNACGGAYVPPPNPNPEQNLSVKDAKSYISADSVQQNSDGSYQLTGDAELYRGPLRLSCDNMIYNPNTTQATMQGNVQIRDPQLYISADEATFTNELHDGSIENAKYVFYNHEVQGSAKQIQYDGGDKDLVYLHNATMSTCPPDAETWQVEATEIELNNETEWGKAFNSIIRVEDIPVFYWPYIDFPLSDKRKTGFLYPAISISGDEGFDLEVPYYVNVAPNFDLTFSPRFNTEHGLLHQAEARYLNSWSMWQINGSYISGDRRINRMNASESPNINRDRYLYALTESGNFDANWSSYINFTQVSDVYYLRDWGAQGLDIQKTRNIKREARIAYNSLNWQFRTEVIDYQSLQLVATDPDDPNDTEVVEEYKQLPKIEAVYLSSNSPFELEPIFVSQAIYFEHPDDIDAIRTYLQPGIGFPMAWQAVEVNPRLVYKRTDFRFSDNNDINPPSGIQTSGAAHISVPTFSLDTSVFLEAYRKSHIQTLTPRLFYYYARFQDQDSLPSFDTTENYFSYSQLFRDSRFSSYDRIGDANQLTVAFESEWLRADDGSPIADIGIGQILYFEDRRVSVTPSERELKPTSGEGLTHAQIEANRAFNEQANRRYYNSTSDIATQANWYIDTFNSMRAEVLYDSVNNKFQEGSISYHFQGEGLQIINLSYRYRQDIPKVYGDNNDQLYKTSISETDVSVVWPLARDWSTVARWHFDLTHTENIEHILGFKYQGCCASITFAYQRERNTVDGVTVEELLNPEFNNRWFIEFELKGFGAITSSLTRLLEEKIQGYP